MVSDQAKKVYIIHGWDGAPDSDWYPWLKNELEKKGFAVEVPAMPGSSEPKIDAWISQLKKCVGALDKNTNIIAHSIGCQAVMRFLEKETYRGKIGKVIFVAGWFKLDNLEGADVKAVAKPWLTKAIDGDNVRRKMSELTVFLSSNEPYGFVQENAEIFKKKLRAKVIIEKNKGHFSQDDGITSVPEVLIEFLSSSKKEKSE